MIDLPIYLLKVSAGLAIISVPYYFLLRNDPNLNLKRLYLLLGILASWIFPLIVFRRPEVLLNLTPTVFIDPGEESTLPIALDYTASSTGITLNWIRILVMIYLSGLSFMFLKNLFIILRWNIAWKKNRTREGVAYTRSDQVFTLFTKIFVPAALRDKEDLKNILLHERAHVQQLHFIDLMMMELTLLLTWFNPFSWLISRMIKENHEHLADRQVLSAGISPAAYRAQLLNHTLGVDVFRLGMQFNHSITFKRFKMMKKPKNSPKGIVKMALMVPALLIAMGLTTGMTPIQQKTVKGKVVFAENGEPAPGTSVVIKNSTVGTVVDRDGTFRLNVDGDPEIVFSFVGYKTMVRKASKIGKKPLELEQTVAIYDLGKVSLVVKEEDNKSISIRTTNGSDKQPIFVLDGEIISEIDNLDPESIESISVFKDPESEEVKKHNAPNGVVVITSKKAAAQVNKEDVDVLHTEEEVFYVVEDMPMFPGGKSALKTYIYSKLEYPAELKEKGISGEANIQFLVSAKGEIKDVKAISSTHKEFEAPAMDVFKGMSKWNPGKQRGKPVQIKVVVPVKFSAQK